VLPAQVLIRYNSESWAAIEDGTFIECEIQAGPTSWRRPNNGTDLADVRDALACRGYRCRRSVLHAGSQGSRKNPTVHLDTWIQQRKNTEPPTQGSEAPSADAATSDAADHSTSTAPDQLQPTAVQADFPARLILSRAAPHLRPPVAVFATDPVHNQRQLDGQIALYTRLNAMAGPAAPQYDMVVACLTDAPAAIDDLFRRLTRELAPAT